MENYDPRFTGLDATKLQAAVDYVFEDTWNTQGLIVIKDGKIVYEKYEGISDLSIAGHQRVFNAANSSLGMVGEQAGIPLNTKPYLDPETKTA